MATDTLGTAHGLLRILLWPLGFVIYLAILAYLAWEKRTDRTWHPRRDPQSFMLDQPEVK